MDLATVRSKEVLHPLLLLCVLIPCFAVQYLVPFLVLQSAGEKRVACFTLIVCLTSCDCLCSVALSNVGWSAVCDCGI